jgi:hypothetical protein
VKACGAFTRMDRVFSCPIQSCCQVMIGLIPTEGANRRPKPVVPMSVRSAPDGSRLRWPRKVDQKQAVCYRDCCPRMLSRDDRNLALTDLYPVLPYT